MTQKEKQEKFLELLEPVHQRLARFARAMAGNSDDARDIAAETVLRAYENFDKIKDYSAFPGYLFSIASRYFKRNRYRGRIFSEADGSEENFPAHGTAPDVSVDVGILYKAMDELPEKQKEAIALFEISGLSIEEIREIQGGTISGVKSRLKRGREKLAEILGVDEEKKTKLNGAATNGTAKKKIEKAIIER
jgi:RNA polymerase sigma-70 factor (ECF subfamily)